MQQRFGENKVGKIAMGVLGMTLVACLVYSAATEERRYSAYTPSVGLAQRKVMQGDIRKMEMQLAAKEVRSSSSGTAVTPCGAHPHPRETRVAPAPARCSPARLFLLACVRAGRAPQVPDACATRALAPCCCRCTTS